MEERYYCRECQIVSSFDSRRKTHPCWRCKNEMWYLGMNSIVNGTLYNAYVPYDEKELKIPEGTEYLEWGAYRNKTNLSTILFPSTIKDISGCCFDGCTSLKRVEVPGSVKTLGYSAYANCISLNEVLLTDGIEVIDEKTFYGCCHLKAINFPASLKKIGKEAFSTNSNHKLIALSRNITEIGENAFGEAANSNAFFLVPKDSFAEEYAKANNCNYRIYEVLEGFISNGYEYAGTLFCSTKVTSSVRIKSGIQTIATGAFSGQKSINEVVFPNSLKEIQDRAFESCKGIEKLTFNNGLTTIGSKAFSDTKLKLVNLPITVKNLAADAFPEKCIVAIGDEMPGYAERISEFEERRNHINQYVNALSNVEKNIELISNKIALYDVNAPTDLFEIPDIKVQQEKISTQIQNENQKKEKEISELTDKLNEVSASIDQLNAERKKCSLFALSRKKEINVQITAAIENVNSIKEIIRITENEYSKKLGLLSTEQSKINSKLRRLEDIQKSRDEEKHKVELSLTQSENEKQNLLITIKEAGEKLNQDKALFDDCHIKWSRSYEKAKKQREIKENAAKEAERIAKLRDEKENLIAELAIPEISDTKLAVDDTSSSIDEVQLNNIYQKILNNRNERKYITELNEFITVNSDKIKKAKELNKLLGLPEDDNIEKLSICDVPESLTINLPERFVKLNKYFGKTDIWKSLKSSAKETTMPKKPKSNFCDELFAGIDYLKFSGNGIMFLLFPYCAVIYKSNHPIKVCTYDSIHVKIESIDKEHTGESIPSYGELISQRYTHINADGSPSKRYKDNPVIKIIRFTRVLFFSGHSALISIPVDSYQKAESLLTAFDSHRDELLEGTLKTIYSYVTEQKDYQEIEEQISKLAQQEKENKLKIIREKKAEQKRIEEERREAEATAEAQRLAIIQRQRELNAERKRQEEEKKKKSLQLEKMFDDDFNSSSIVDNVLDDTKANTLNTDARSVEIIGNRTISNTVFKVTLKMLDYYNSELTAYFSDEDNTVISNRKKMNASSNECITLGFVLNSGVDYSAMKKCILHIVQKEKSIGEIAFNMSIAFSPDDF